MTKPAFTPGPWRWDGDQLWHIGESYESEVDWHIYTGIKKECGPYGAPIVEANASLIAAAPEMYEMLKEALSIIEADTNLSVLPEEIRALLYKIEDL